GRQPGQRRPGQLGERTIAAGQEPQTPQLGTEAEAFAARHALQETALLERGGQPGGGALVDTEQLRKLANGQLLALTVEGQEHLEDSIHSLNEVVAHNATIVLYATMPQVKK